MWVDVLGRHQPDDGATYAEPVAQSLFSRPRERWPSRGRRRHAMVVGVLMPPDAACVTTCATLAAQQCTQTPQNGAERPDPPICVHYCDPKATHNLSPQPNSVHKCPKTAPRGRFSQSVYNPASPWPLTRPGGATGSTTSTAPWSRDARALGPEVHAAGAVTHPSTRAHDASYIMQFFAQFNVTKHNSA